MRHRSPLVISGDLHAIGAGEIQRSGTIDLNDNPVTAILGGPVGTSPQGWPSELEGYLQCLPCILMSVKASPQ